MSCLCFLLASCCGPEPNEVTVEIHEVPVAGANKPFPPKEAPKRMTLPPGFKATLFAGEPDLVQPIAFALDDQGRVWVAECLSYPNWQRTGHDRILIFEDSKGTGAFDKQAVFHDKIANISGIQLGFGGVWVAAIPNLLFIPIRDDGTAGEPKVLLDGWCTAQIGTSKMQGKHHVPNSLTWGPDGWLYGCGGISAACSIGKPGATEADRTLFKGGVWRYHPIRHRFEVVAWGTTNPWGLDFDDYGQMFITNNVTEHLFHVVPGAHFIRSHGQDFNPHVYDLMKGCADHLHYAGSWKQSREKVHGDMGGGHSHSGAMVYLGDNWPSDYRNNVFMCNLHGSRVNRDILERQASGYVAHHADDFMLANDPWFRGLALQYGPDGGVFVSDWTDTGECHNYREIDRSNGRIYKITYGTPKTWSGDVSKLSDAELVNLQLHKNDWHVRHARRILQERAAAGKLAPETEASLRKILEENPDVTRKLRALWALHVIGRLDEKLVLELLDHPEEMIRCWAVQLGLETHTASLALHEKLAQMAAKEHKALVQLYLAAGLQRLPVKLRWRIAEGLIQHAPDEGDHNLPLMVWYGIEPICVDYWEGALAMIPKSKIPIVRENLARRVALLESEASSLPALVKLLDQQGHPDIQADILRGLEKAIRGRRLPLPEGWPAVYRKLAESKQPEIRNKALRLSILFGDEETLRSMRKLMMDPKARAEERLKALIALAEVVDAKDNSFPALLHTLIKEPVMRLPALRELSRFSHPATPEIILGQYATFNGDEKTAARRTLISRKAYALAMLRAVDKRIPRKDLTAEDLRRLRIYDDKEIHAELARLNLLPPAKEDVVAAKKKWKSILTPAYLKQADLSNGRLVFKNTCSNCHRLFDDGEKIGPELTGSQRHNLDYILDKVLDPNAIVAEEYRETLLALDTGETLKGLVLQENNANLTMLVNGQNPPRIIPKNQIEQREKLPQSIMPEGLFGPPLTQVQVRDLIAYLASQQQVPLPKPRASR